MTCKSSRRSAPSFLSILWLAAMARTALTGKLAARLAEGAEGAKGAKGTKAFGGKGFGPKGAAICGGVGRHESQKRAYWQLVVVKQKSMESNDIWWQNSRPRLRKNGRGRKRIAFG